MLRICLLLSLVYCKSRSLGSKQNQWFRCCQFIWALNVILITGESVCIFRILGQVQVFVNVSVLFRFYSQASPKSLPSQNFSPIGQRK